MARVHSGTVNGTAASFVLFAESASVAIAQTVTSPGLFPTSRRVHNIPNGVQIQNHRGAAAREIWVRFDGTNPSSVGADGDFFVRPEETVWFPVGTTGASVTVRIIADGSGADFTATLR